jgi:predicted dehydrogenase
MISATSTSDNGAPRLRAAVIGTGVISEEHLRYLSAAPGVELAAVCDLSPSLANYAVMRFKAGRAFTDTADMLRTARPDVVHVLTPPHTHVPLATQCLDAGAHVIVEKPVAPSNKEFHDLWSHARSRNKWLVEDHNYRFNEPILQIGQMLDEGRLGDVREVEVRMVLDVMQQGSRFTDENIPHPSHKMPAGLIHEFITHLCYLTLRFMPSWDRIAAAWSKQGDHPLFKYDDLDALLIGAKAHARIRFSTYTAPDAFTVTVRGTKGWAETDLFQPHVRTNVQRPVGKQLNPLANQFLGGCGLVRASVVGFRNKVLQKTPYEGLATFLDRTYAALRHNAEPPVGFDDMDRASKLVDALLSEENQIRVTRPQS